MDDLDITVVTDIEGLDELEEAFTSGSARAVKKFLRRVGTKAGKVLKDAVSENAPYDTGALSEDIHIQNIANSDGMTTRVGPSQATFYGLFQEFGAPEQNVPALHWMEEGAKSVQDEVLEEYNQAVADGLEDMKG
jgi:HK97 gp10 family phage protein